MPDRPLAYFLTFTTYGTWLHGDGRGSVDREHNQPGEPWPEPDPARREGSAARLAQPPYLLDAVRVLWRVAVVMQWRARQRRRAHS